MKRNPSGIRAAAFFAALVGAITVSGCASANAPTTLPKELPERNRAQWVLPLDQYSARMVDPERVAAQLMVQPCLREQGIEWSATTMEVGAKPGESWNSAARKLFDVHLAEKYGYGNSDELGLPVEQLQQLRDIDMANRNLSEYHDEIDECFGQAQHALGMPDNEEPDPDEIANKLSVEAFEASLVTKPVLEATARWRECMADVGVPDLEKSPDLMPPDSIIALDPGIDQVKPIGVFDVDPEERRVAIADATCREKTGYAEAAYDAEWNEEVTLIAKNADTLERYDKKRQKMDRKAKKVIADYTPDSR